MPTTPTVCDRQTGKPNRAARTLLDRLQEYEADTLRSRLDFGVPFDYPRAGRDSGLVEVQQKVSGAFGSRAGAEGLCARRSDISMLPKQGRSILTALEHVFAGSPLSPQIWAE